MSNKNIAMCRNKEKRISLGAIPKTYSEMFDRAVDEQVKEPQDGLQES